MSVVLITGVASGIGLATAKLFSGKGWKVAGIDNKPGDFSFVDYYIQTDLADPEQITKAVAQLKVYTDSLHALVNNAAYHVCAAAQETSLYEWDRVMSVNVRAPFLLAQKLYSLLAHTSGCIVNISSVHALATSENIAAYAASKGALVALTRAQAIDFSKDGVRVNVLLPGAVDTPMLEEGLIRAHNGEVIDIPDLKARMASKTVSGKIGTSNEIAEVIYFLADNRRAGYINGQTLVVDGGALSRLSTE